METVSCPICKSESSHSFWFWENEDVLMREWAPDCRLHFSICRVCATIFQDPPASISESPFSMDFSMDASAHPMNEAHEPLDWLSQFSGKGQDALRTLEVYSKKPKFEETLKSRGWDVKAVSAKEFRENDWGQDGPYDLVICFDALNECDDPEALAQKAHAVLKDDGGFYVDVVNPLVLPRGNQICFTAYERVLIPFPTLMYLTYKNGFKNLMSEVTGSVRSYLQKIPVPASVSPSEVASKDYWSYVTYRCERNYWFAWTGKFLAKFIQLRQTDPHALDTARNELRHDTQRMQIIREVCGVMLLFAQEVQTLQQSLSGDWHQTMARIFDVLKNDLVMYDLLQLEPMENLGLMVPMHRFFLNEKMVYTTDADYFKKYFNQDDAELLCNYIFKSSQTVVGHLSSFL